MTLATLKLLATITTLTARGRDPDGIWSFIIASDDSTLVTLIVPAFYIRPNGSEPRFPWMEGKLRTYGRVFHTILICLLSAVFIYVPVGTFNLYFLYEGLTDASYLWKSLVTYVGSVVIFYPCLLLLFYKVNTL